MGSEFVKVGQTEVVAVHVAQVCIGIVRHGKFASLKGGGGEGENLVAVARVVKRDAHARGVYLSGQETAKTTQEGMGKTIVKLVDAPYTTEAAMVVSACTPYFVRMAGEAFGEQMEGDGVSLNGENINVNTPFAPKAIVAVGFAHPRTAVSHFSVEVEIGGVGVGGLQGQVRRQFVGQNTHETKIILAHHLNVQVVVPRNKSAVAHGTEEGATAEPVGDVVLAADAVDLKQDVEHPKLVGAQKRTVGIETPAK